DIMDTDEEGEDDCDISADLLDASACASRRAGGARDRVILHFDLDCYYAQVEMIRNPALRTKPLGVQQKYIIVTCNYLARELGVTKLMSLKEALERCPQLVIVKGEDLTCYREMSYRVTELLMSYCPLVERLGFDENFVDATELVENRLKDTDISSLSFVGHIYKHDALAVDVQEHARLALGSIIAAEMREALWSRLGLTSCAGIASSKLMAKLVSGTFKPNQQTALLPQSTAELMGSLAGPCKVPGIGYKTTVYAVTVSGVGYRTGEYAVVSAVTVSGVGYRTGEYAVVSAMTVSGVGYRTGEYAVVSAVTVSGVGYRTGEYAVVSAVTVLGIGYRTGEYAVVSAVTVLGVGYRTGEYAVVSAVTVLGIGYRTGEYAVVSAVTVLGIGYRMGEYAVVSAVTVSGVGYRTGEYAVVSAVTVLGIGYRTGEYAVVSAVTVLGIGYRMGEYAVVSAVTVSGVGYRTGEYAVVSAMTVSGVGYRTGEYAVVSAVTVSGVGYRTGEYAVVSAMTVSGVGYRTGEYAVVSAVTVSGVGYRTGEYAVVSAVTVSGVGYRTGKYAVVSAMTVSGVGYRTGKYAVVSAMTVSGVGYRTGEYAVVSAVTVLGIGYRTGEKLKALGVLSVRALQVAPLFELASEFGEATAKRIQNLAYGIDPSPVTPAGPPQSLSDEDSFRKISTVMEVEGKVRELLSCLMERMRKDGRLPQTLRLTLRRSTALNRWFCRESRQCPIPHHTAHRVVTGCSDAVPQLVSIAMKLFHRLVDVGEGFHLTLLNVCFTNLQAKGSDRNSISSYLTHTPPTAAHTSTQGQDMVGGLSPNGPSSRTQTRTVAGVKDTHKRKELFPHTALSSSFSSPPSSSSSSSSEPLGQKSLPQAVQAHTPVPPWRPILEHSDEKRVDPGDSRRASVLEERKGLDLPPHVDPDVFGALPEHIQMELLASFQTGGSVPEDSTEAQGSAHTSRFAEQLTVHPNREGGSRHRESSVSHSNHSMAHNDDFSTEHAQNEELCREGQRSEERHAMEDAAGVPVAQTSHPDIPPNVDPCVFSQLPPDMQAELLADWKQRRPTLKVPSKLATKHSAARAGKPAAKGSQSNSLLKYFKPS
ncbi:hypothetical protein P4O66_005421, partial [Electrophorus voltai]